MTTDESRQIMDFATGVYHLVDEMTIEPWNKSTDHARSDCGRQGYIAKPNPFTEDFVMARAQRRCLRCRW